MKARIGLFLPVLVVLMLAACGLTPPKSLEQRIAYGNGALTGVLNATSVSLENGQISVDDAKAVRTTATQAAYFLDAAEAAHTEAEGQDKLALATALLAQLQTYLNSKGK